jgi:acyl carrier protein
MLDPTRTTQITNQIIALIAKSKSIDPATLTPATTFDELQIDSLDKINLSFEVEELFHIEIPDAALNSLRTVGDVIAGVERLQLEKASQPTA